MIFGTIYENADGLSSGYGVPNYSQYSSIDSRRSTFNDTRSMINVLKFVKIYLWSIYDGCAGSRRTEENANQKRRAQF